MEAQTRYIVLETLISSAINAALSIAFVFLAFRGQSQIAAAGKHGLVADMAPQTFMVVLMACLVPALLTRRRLRAGALQWRGTECRLAVSQICVMAVLAALLASCVVVATCWYTLPHLFPRGMDFGLLVICKTLFGLLLAAVVTPWAILRTLP